MAALVWICLLQYLLWGRFGMSWKIGLVSSILVKVQAMPLD